MKTKLTDFSYAELVWLSVIVEKQVNELCEKVQWIEANPSFCGEDLLTFFKQRFDAAQLWFTQINNAMIEVRSQEIIKCN